MFDVDNFWGPGQSSGTAWRWAVQSDAPAWAAREVWAIALPSRWDPDGFLDSKKNGEVREYPTREAAEAVVTANGFRGTREWIPVVGGTVVRRICLKVAGARPSYLPTKAVLRDGCLFEDGVVPGGILPGMTVRVLAQGGPEIQNERHWDYLQGAILPLEGAVPAGATTIAHWS